MVRSRPTKLLLGVRRREMSSRDRQWLLLLLHRKQLIGRIHHGHLKEWTLARLSQDHQFPVNREQPLFTLGLVGLFSARDKLGLALQQEPLHREQLPALPQQVVKQLIGRILLGQPRVWISTRLRVVLLFRVSPEQPSYILAQAGRFSVALQVRLLQLIRGCRIQHRPQRLHLLILHRIRHLRQQQNRRFPGRPTARLRTLLPLRQRLRRVDRMCTGTR